MSSDPGVDSSASLVRDKCVSAGLFVLLLLLQYRVWVGEGSIAHVQQLHAEIDVQQQVNERYRSRNDQIEREIISLKSDPEAIEQRARRELGMIQPGETYFVFIDEEATTGVAANASAENRQQTAP